jgi:hypothetical protein
MKYLAIFFSALAVGMLILGVVEDATNFRWADDQNTFFGNPNWVMNDGKTVLILAGILVLTSAALWLYWAMRRD